MDNRKYIGMDVHQASISIAVQRFRNQAWRRLKTMVDACDLDAAGFEENRIGVFG